MNQRYLGDSYDIVKRFFCSVLREQGYDVFVDPIFTGEWRANEKLSYYRFLGAEPIPHHAAAQGPTALLLDPDTGVSKRARMRYLSFGAIARLLEVYRIILAFDQSFSRNCSPAGQIKQKLDTLAMQGCKAFYYDSHARFLFASRSAKAIDQLYKRLIDHGLPKARLVARSPDQKMTGS